MLYQLSYFRKKFFEFFAGFLAAPRQCKQVSIALGLHKNSAFYTTTRLTAVWLKILRTGGRRWIRTTEGINQQIYSLPHLATLVFSQKNFEPMEGVEPTTPRLQITCSSQLSYIGNFPIFVSSFPKGIAKIDIIFYSPKLLQKFLNIPPKFWP